MAEKIMLISGDGKEFSVDKTVAVQIVENGDGAGKGIQIPQVTGEILSKVIEYYEKHVSSDDKELKKWDADFMKVDQQTLFDIIRVGQQIIVSYADCMTVPLFTRRIRLSCSFGTLKYPGSKEWLQVHDCIYTTFF